MMKQFVLICAVLGGAISGSPASAQSLPRTVVEGSVGWAGFADDTVIHHRVLGAAARVYLSPRISIGPEITYMRGPGSDRDLIVTGNLMFDLLRDAGAGRRPTPYVIAGGGLLRHSDRFRSGTYASTEGAFTAGGGVRIPVTPAVFIAPEVRIGWEPHLRAGATFGWRF